MPLYTYECEKCGKEMDKVFSIKDYPRVIDCGYCGNTAKKILAAGHGGIQTDGDVTWLPSAVKVLQRPGERPIETRTEHKAYLKSHNYSQIG
jgi:putative FmdB family regulatory protein